MAIGKAVLSGFAPPNDVSGEGLHKPGGHIGDVPVLVLGDAVAASIDAFRRTVLERAFPEDTGVKRRSPGVNRPSALFHLKRDYSVLDRKL